MCERIAYSAVRVTRPEGDLGCSGIANVQLRVVTIHPRIDDADILRGSGIGQRVSIRVSEVVGERILDSGDRVHGQSTDVQEEDPVPRWRLVGRALSGVRPGAFALLAREGAHLGLVGRPWRQVRQVDAGGGRGQGRGRVTVRVFDGVVRPCVGGFALGDLHAVLGLVPGDGQAVGGGGSPGHVQRRVRRLAELRARQRRRAGNDGLEVGDVDGEVRDGGLALNGPVHLALVGVLGLVIESGPLLHGDLAGRTVDLEVGRRRARQRVGVYLIVIRLGRLHPGHRRADVRAGWGALGYVPCHIGGNGERDAARGVAPVTVAHPVCGRRRPWIAEAPLEFGTVVMDRDAGDSGTGG